MVIVNVMYLEVVRTSHQNNFMINWDWEGAELQGIQHLLQLAMPILVNNRSSIIGTDSLIYVVVFGVQENKLSEQGL